MKGDDALVVRLPPGAVALETAFLATGLPEDVALETAESMAAAVRDAGSQPAFIGVLDGRAIVGL
ncbi:MAG TPA: pseudouridine-5'-phosphate glycosidase, partial [Gemmatimonadota bacterium]|nr:pseudouridine-5'-phosphate glycosidase [Gemmatimonadota bacterium]